MSISPNSLRSSADTLRDTGDDTAMPLATVPVNVLSQNVHRCSLGKWAAAYHHGSAHRGGAHLMSIRTTAKVSTGSNQIPDCGFTSLVLGFLPWRSHAWPRRPN